MQKIVPDIQFKKELGKLSKAPLNECIQCGTCSVVCSLAPDERPFPRKEMIWAAWGLKDRLIGNPDIWLCHQCGDCSGYCPRDVKPADVLSAARHVSYVHYARPAFLGRMLSRPAWLPLALLIPVAGIITILSLAGTFSIPEGPVEYSKFFPHSWLNSSFSILTLVIIAFTVTGLTRFWKDMQSKFPGQVRKKSFVRAFISLLRELVTHRNFTGCSAQSSRKIAHLMVFYGFILLLFVTAYAIYAAISKNYPLAFTNPFKLLGNLASLFLITGLAIMIINRILNRDKYGHTGYSDWLFLVSLLVLTISGSLVEAARFGNWNFAYHLYFFHLCTVWFVIIYLPYMKFGHLLYRTTAMIFAKTIGRK